MAAFSRVTPAGWAIGNDSSAFSRVKPGGWLVSAATGGGGATYTLTADAGTLTLTGQAATLAHGRVLVAAAGSLTLSGQAATFSYSGDPYTYTLTAEAGVLTLTGQSATRDLSMRADAGTLSLTGQAAGLVRGRTLNAEAGSLTLTGQAATVAHHRVLVAEAGSLSLSGQTAGFSYSGNPFTYTLDAEAGTLTLSGQAASFYKGTQTTSEWFLPLRAYAVADSQAVDPEADLNNLRSLLPRQAQAMVNADGTARADWYRFFDYLVNVFLGGPGSPTMSDVVAAIEAALAAQTTQAAQTALIAQQSQTNAEALAAVVQVAVDNSLSGADQIPRVSQTYLEP